VNLRWSALSANAAMTSAQVVTDRIPPIVLLGTWSVTLVVLAAAQVCLQRRALDGALALVCHLGRDATVVIVRHGEVQIHTRRCAAQARRPRRAPPRRGRRPRSRGTGKRRRRPREPRSPAPTRRGFSGRGTAG
jgi:hypothetical protein